MGCSMLSTPKNSSRSDFIEALRGVFALWVLFAHLISWTIFADFSSTIPAFIQIVHHFLISFFQSAGETHPAVLGFIVLSGYCIHRNGFRNEPIKLQDYALRRFFRIYPVYLIALIVGVICFEYNSSISPELAYALNATPSLGVWQILGKISGISAFIPFYHQQTFQGNAPLHTVMVECWLYVCYPFLMHFFIRNNRERYLWATLVFIWIMGISLIALKPGLNGWWHNGAIFSFLLYWWIGAKFVDQTILNRTLKYIPAIACAWFLLLYLGYLGIGHFIFFVELKKVLFCLLFASFLSYFDQSITTKNPIIFNFEKWIAKAVGKSSYSIYAFHAPLIQLFIINEFGSMAAFFCVIFSGTIFFYILEKPMIQLGKAAALYNKKSLLSSTV